MISLQISEWIASSKIFTNWFYCLTILFHFQSHFLFPAGESTAQLLRRFHAEQPLWKYRAFALQPLHAGTQPFTKKKKYFFYKFRNFFPKFWIFVFQQMKEKPLGNSIEMSVSNFVDRNDKSHYLGVVDQPVIPVEGINVVEPFASVMNCQPNYKERAKSIVSV